MVESLQTGRPGLEIRPLALPRPTRREVVRRAQRILTVLGRNLGPELKGRDRGASRLRLARGLRAAFEELEATFVKLGQLIASAPSLFGDELSAEFRSCLDAGPPILPAQLRRAIELEFGRPLESVFSELEPEPLAAASLAVVHRGRLDDGRLVAVKVIRPGVRRTVASDLAVMRPLFAFAGRVIAIGIAAELSDVLDGLEEQIAEELDLRNEAASMWWFRDVFGEMGLPRVHIPEPIPGLCGRRVLTMELLDGVPIDDQQGIARLGVDPKPLMQEAVQAFFATALCAGAFHGDIHAGNLMITTEGRIGLLDWGIVGRLDAHTRLFFRRIVEGSLGDDSAWTDVASYLKDQFGEQMRIELGLDDDQMVSMAKASIEPLLARPFGELDLTTLVGGPSELNLSQHDGSIRAKYQHWRMSQKLQREFRARDGAGNNFDRGMFLLAKQLVYLERYGKMYLPDVPLLWDEQVFRGLLARPVEHPCNTEVVADPAP
ncbi:MAG: hypothetical protein JJLCMIEE_00771 [Acidimicrobiales bacterium]|nr:hypothetical protein [Acidimicrobiales bacterium]